ncbi:TetR/AcrR family transcriptional regulator C-terminal domain-containing protein [Amycolatopsis sp. DSM 110486]|uniref:TetR/AcrR family transcriptional regulator C-terminal domain-containing protein n=1 Tax=Amycolatopsis sp. DSM 110486 TaxID=2865832 RepID=UPI001C69EB6A|nr:TetR/AcrR family transcriptional regulator C-terminal domain-containing protein [Amycolatopsis sp. DSM 110486]QYN22344.1 TetR/AcrR family transcriptional regulator C-terminal domain-containing protein [Amycolatopsis sp. DSM 110486]
MAKTREKLSRETIVDGALALADREGLDALTIRRLAQDHGVTPMALYWHFKDKHELVAGLAERLLADVSLPDSDGPWDTRLRAALVAVLAAVRPHPAVAGLVPPRILESDAGLTVADHVLGLLRKAGFTAEEAAELGGYLLCAGVTLVTAEPGATDVHPASSRDEAVERKRVALAALPPERFPNVAAAADALAVCGDEDSYFERGVDLLVSGVRGLR